MAQHSAQSAEKVRQEFIDFFTKDKGHTYAHSIPLVPAGDPTLLFTNSGMVQFKGIFLGMEQRPYTRAANSQRCLRVSGKHNDLEDVGKDTYHHTFFEMLGNWSFGDYYKPEAIEWAWELLTKRYGIDGSRLWASVYKNDPESKGLWPRIVGMPSERVWEFGEKHNFWEMGETGPCGPCSEIHYDRGEKYGCSKPSCGPNCDCGRYIELWNLVFIQYNREADGKLTNLPKTHVDTGMGFERLVAVLQGKDSNYDTDLFAPLLSAVADRTGLEYGQDGRNDMSFRVLADHIRGVTFLIADGVVPTNEGRGYVLRRIMRRAIRHGKKLGLHEPFLFELSGRVIDAMRQVFPEIVPQARLIADVIKNEEERFMETLDMGLQLVGEEVEHLKSAGKTILPGDVVFKLYDTYGFPADLTRTIADEEGLHVDEDGFHAAMEKQREMGQNARKSKEAGVIAPEILDRVKALKSTFSGYERLEDDGRITALFSGSREVREAREGETVDLVADATPLYPMGGGQIGDRGRVSCAAGEGEVVDTVPIGTGDSRVILHKVKVLRGRLAVGEDVKLKVDARRREATRLNHSATHLMHAALREVLGKHVRQYGSLVEPERLRFDFTHFAPLTPVEIKKINGRVQEAIRANLKIETLIAGMDEAKKMGALMFFGDKYGDSVRVLRMGNFSIELCGGTHVSTTGEIGIFKLIQAGGVGAGIRRVQAVTGEGAVQELDRMVEWLERSAGTLQLQDASQLPRRIEELIEENRKLKSELESARKRAMAGEAEEVAGKAEVVAGVKAVYYWCPEEKSAGELRVITDRIRSNIKSGVVFAGSITAGTVAPIVVGITPDLTGRYHAGTILKQVAPALEGKGGGKADFAQGIGRPELREKGRERFIFTLKSSEAK
ncbi:MAG: alanine--tRNA ligase [Nitrospirae bacterium]|nr:alanine--tRNA ligase [Nitrospirota bacterium]